MEGWHSKINKLLRKKHPGVVLVIQISQEGRFSIESAILKLKANSGIQAKERPRRMQMKYLKSALVHISLCDL